jgi:hypothetical protein
LWASNSGQAIKALDIDRDSLWLFSSCYFV